MMKIFSILTIASTVNSIEAINRLSSLRGGSSATLRDLQEEGIYVVTGECLVENFSNAVGGDAILADYLSVANDKATMQAELDDKCATVLEGSIDLSDTLKEGPQFLKNFLDGGTPLNDYVETTTDGEVEYSLTEDASVIVDSYEDAKKTTFSSPDGGANAKYDKYFSNFFRGDMECPLGVIECCYTDSRLDNSPIVDNAEMCAMDLTVAKRTNHIAAGSYTVFNTEAADKTYCSGFAYEADSFGDKVKYNTLFAMAMKTNLYDKGYVKNIPGAPMCGCVEQMPIVTNAACTKVVEGYTINKEGDISINLSWEDCGMSLAAYYDSLDRPDMEKMFVKKMIVGDGKCPDAITSFMSDKMMVPV